MILTTYNETHQTTLVAFPAPQAPQDNSDSIVMNDPTLMANAGIAPTQNTSATARNIIATLTALFSTSWAQYLTQHNQNQLRIRLAKFSVEALDAPATDDTQMITNEEPNVEPSVVGDLIHNEVVKQNKNLTATVKKLQTHLDSLTLAKNSNRRSTVSSKKQNNRNPKSKSKNQNEPAQAAESNKDSDAAKQPKKGKGTKKKNGKQSNRSRSRSPGCNKSRGKK